MVPAAATAGLFVTLALAADLPASSLPTAAQCLEALGGANADDATCRFWLQWQEAEEQLRARGLSPVPIRDAARQLAGSSESSADSHGNSTAIAHDQTGAHGHGSDSHHGAHAHDAFVFMFVALACGCIINYVLSRVAPTVPYTVTLYLVGMIVGLLDNRVRAGTDSPSVFSQSVVMWKDMDPHMMLHAFLPALLFGDAFGINRHQFFKSFASCTILATVGVLYGTLLTGVVIHYASPKSITFYEACTAGSILSATDPVAVVAILNALGASAKLNMLVSGESLMNDGVALVVYSIFHNLSLGQEYTGGEVVVFFIRLFFGGALLGLLFGAITLGLLSLVNSRFYHDDTLIQTSIMFCAAYLSFWVAESKHVHVSGVLACVTCSMFVGFYGPQLLVERDKVLHVWHFAEYVGNTLLFVLAGVIIGDALVSDTLQLDSGDVLWLVALYFILVLIRGVVIFTFFPALRKLGYGLQWQEAVVMVWGGLRGAVGLALAVEMASTATDVSGHKLDPDAITRRKYILLQVGMFTTATLVINAPTTGFVLRKLGLIRTTYMQQRQLKSHEFRMAEDSRAFYATKAHHKLWEGHIKSVVHGVLEASYGGSEHGGEFELSSLNCSDRDPELLSLFRICFLRLVTAEYWNMVDHSVLPVKSEVLQNLLSSVEHAQDHLNDPEEEGLKDWEFLEHIFIRHQSWDKLCLKSCCGKVGRLISTELRHNAAAIILCFIGAHEGAQSRAEHHLVGGWQAHILQESQTCVQKAWAFLDQHFEGRDVAEVKTWTVCRSLIEFQRTKVEKWVSHGIINSAEAHKITHHIDKGNAYLHSLENSSLTALLPSSSFLCKQQSSSSGKEEHVDDVEELSLGVVPKPKKNDEGAAHFEAKAVKPFLT